MDRIDYMTNVHLPHAIEIGDRVTCATRWDGSKAGELLALDNTRGKIGLLYAEVRFDDGVTDWYLAQHLWPEEA